MWKKSANKAKKFCKELGFEIIKNGKGWSAEKGNLAVIYDGDLWDRLTFSVKAERGDSLHWVDVVSFDFEFEEFKDLTFYIESDYNLLASVDDFSDFNI